MPDRGSAPLLQVEVGFDSSHPVSKFSNFAGQQIESRINIAEALVHLVAKVGELGHEIADTSVCALVLRNTYDRAGNRGQGWQSNHQCELETGNLLHGGLHNESIVNLSHALASSRLLPSSALW